MSNTAAQLASALTAHAAAQRQVKAAEARLADTIAFSNAAWHAERARFWRDMKCAARARHHEARVRDIAQQSELELARRVRAAGAGAH